MTNSIENLLQSPLLRMMLIGFIILVLQIPIGLLYGVISERQASRDAVEYDITQKWGTAQEVVGPVLVVPYRRYIEETLKDGGTKRTALREQAIFLPTDLDVQSEVHVETRYRGIYEVPVYRTTLSLEGSFSRIDFAEWDIDPKDILWDKSSVTVLITDVRALTNSNGLKWGERVVALEPGAKFGDSSGVHAPLRPSDLSEETIPFSLHLSLNGSNKLAVAPVGSQTEFEVKSNWADPSFEGSWLPQEKTPITADGFESRWSVNLLGRNYPDRSARGEIEVSDLRAATMDVRFMSTVDPYRMASRSVKYELLFLALIFATLWMIEILGGVRLHSIQYFFCGIAMCIFYLLELSLAEHIGFGLAYCIAASMVCVLVTGYCRAVLGTRRRAAAVGGILTLLYAFLFMLLVNQDFALLVGSLGLFAALSGVMYLTRNVAWSPKKSQAQPAP